MTELELQKELHENIKETFREWEKCHPDYGGFWNHQHLCTFDMLPGRKYKKQKCREWCRKHPELKTLPRYDRCDACEMFNYVAVDDEGCIIMTQHPNAAECKKYYELEKHWRETLKNENNYS